MMRPLVLWADAEGNRQNIKATTQQTNPDLWVLGENIRSASKASPRIKCETGGCARNKPCYNSARLVAGPENCQVKNAIHLLLDGVEIQDSRGRLSPHGLCPLRATTII